MTRTPIILLGAGGAVGRRLCRAWASERIDAIALGRTGSSDLRWDADDPPPDLARARGAGVIVLSGVTPGGGDLGDNTRFAQAGVSAARHWGAAHVFVVSSSGVYGETGNSAADEDGPLAPANPYAAAKLSMERATAAPDVTALRLANVAGASQPFRAIRSGGPARLDAFADDPDAPTRSFIGPLALARCLAALCDSAAQAATLPPVLNVAARDPLPMQAIFAAAAVTPERTPAPPGAIAHANLSTERLAGYWDVPRQSAADLWNEVRATDGPAA